MRFKICIVVDIIALIAFLNAAAAFASDITFSDKSLFEYFVPVIDFPNDTALTDYIRSPKLINNFGVDINSGNVKLVSHWDADLIFDSNNITNLVELIAEENYIEWNPSGMRLTIGNQVFTWGKADGINPTAQINRFDYRDPADISKLPAPSVLLSAYPASWISFDAVYMPFKQESLFPYDIASKIPQAFFNKHMVTNLSLDITSLNMATGSMGITSAAATADSVMSNSISYQDDVDLTKPVIAMRANIFTGPVDISFMYAYDIDQFYSPVIELEEYNPLPDSVQSNSINTAVNNAVSNGTIPNNPALIAQMKAALASNINQSAQRISSISLERKRIHRLGLDFKTAVGPVGLWGEACYSFGENPTFNDFSNRNPQLDWTAGFDFPFGPDGDWYINLQYTGTYVFDYDSAFFTDYPGGIPATNQTGNAAYMQEYYYRAFTQQLGNQFEGLTHGFVIRTQWPIFDESIIPSLTLSYFLPENYDQKEETRYGRGSVMADIKWRISDDLSVSLGTSLFCAIIKDTNGAILVDQNDPLGMFYHDSTAYLRLTYAWNFSPESHKE
jgi:hypothetical protein